MLRLAAAAFLLPALTLLLGAQSRPDFSGEWVRTDSATEQRSVAAVGDGAFRTGTMGSGWGSPLTLRQSGNRLVVEYPHFSAYDLQPRITLAFALDGSESRNAIMIGHAALELRSRVTWRDSTLVITTSYPGPVGATEVRQGLTLAGPGSLVVETLHGAPNGGLAVTIRTTWTRR